uniref:Uncharacterized protein n=1 Tax=uncultured Thiotrichaceae bacterium TaxID=298394 RepID=A0A6S6UH89_9GAMM|nr:MAG: Unknown protein [uncultured Thiotrichaceae bacterium]
MSSEEKKAVPGGLEAELQGVEEELHDVEDELHDFEEQQSGISKTLQIIVYPSLVAFVVLAAYGFYLVQSLTTDVHRLTETIASMNETVDRNLTDMSGNIGDMHGQMTSMASSTENMSHHISQMSGTTRTMSGDMRQMNVSTQNMAASTYNMQRDMWSMNKNVSKPFNAMGKFLPFGGSNSNPYVVAPPPTPYYGSNTVNGWYTQPLQQQPQAVKATVPVVPAATGHIKQNSSSPKSSTPATDEGQSFFSTKQASTMASTQ